MQKNWPNYNRSNLDVVINAGPALTVPEAQVRYQFQRDEAHAMTFEDQMILRRIPVWQRIAYSRADRLEMSWMRNRMSRQRAGLPVASLAR